MSSSRANALGTSSLRPRQPSQPLKVLPVAFVVIVIISSHDKHYKHYKRLQTRQAPQHDRCSSPMPSTRTQGSRYPTSSMRSFAPQRRTTQVAPRTSAHRAGSEWLGSPLPQLHRDDGAQAAPHLLPNLGSPLPHLRRDWARSCHICAGTGLTPATATPGLAGFDVIEYTSSALLDQALHPLPAEKLRTRSTLDLAAVEEETLAVGLSQASSAPGLGSPHATLAPGLTLPTTASGLGSPLPQLRRDDGAQAAPHLHRDLGSPLSISAPGLGSPLPHLRRDCVSFMHTLGMPAGIIPRHRPAHFAHLFSGSSYAAAYDCYVRIVR